jgi:6-phospho-beta-glucosidase
MASLIDQGENFAGSEVVLVDLDAERLAIVEILARKLAESAGLDIRIAATTNRRESLTDCDAVLTSFRPGGFQARYLDESIPLRHGVIGQETQGPGGFFMALRAVHVMKGILAEMEAACPRAILFNYTNPVNIVSEAATRHSDISVISLCEGPIIFPRMVARAAGLDPDRVDAVMIGLNHGCWSVRHLYDGREMMPLVVDAWQRRRDDPELSAHHRRLLHLAAVMQSIPADYFQYYYFRDELLADLRSKSTTRAQDILARVPDYWAHYREQAESDRPKLSPVRSRGGLHELELAIDVIDAVFNDRKEVWPVNVPNGSSIPGFPAERVVEVPALVDRHGAAPLAQPQLPRQVAGLVDMLSEYQALAAHAAWEGTHVDAVRALAANPLVPSLPVAEALYREMGGAHREYLPARLVV